jgi:transposase
MRSAKRPSELGLHQYDIARLTTALQRVTDARLLQRVPAVLWVAQGDPSSEVAALTGVRGQTIYTWLQRSLACHQVAALADAPRSGRPVTAPQITAAPILQPLHANPLELGYRTTGWSVKLLAAHLRRQYGCHISPPTLRRRRKALGVRCQRPICIKLKPLSWWTLRFPSLCVLWKPCEIGLFCEGAWGVRPRREEPGVLHPC